MQTGNILQPPYEAPAQKFIHDSPRPLSAPQKAPPRSGEAQSAAHTSASHSLLAIAAALFPGKKDCKNLPQRCVNSH